MKKVIFSVMFALLTAFAFSQELDLNQPYVRIESAVSQETGDFTPEPIAHLIEINTVDKTIKVTRKDSEEVIYDLEYSNAYTGASRSVQMKPGETLFMMRSGKIAMVAYSQNEHTFSFIDNSNQIHLFGQIYILEE